MLPVSDYVFEGLLTPAWAFYEDQNLGPRKLPYARYGAIKDPQLKQIKSSLKKLLEPPRKHRSTQPQPPAPTP